jgi:hypothetical protein
MAAPIAAYVQLPADTANTGKKNRTQTKVAGSDTVHQHGCAVGIERGTGAVYRRPLLSAQLDCQHGGWGAEKR